MRVLALDQATQTGFAVDQLGGGAIPLCGSIRLARGEDAEDIGTLLVGFEDWLLETIGKHLPEVLVFESPFVPRGKSHIQTNENTVRRLIGLAAIAEKVGRREVLRRRMSRVVEVNVATWKRHFCGNGRAEKRHVVERCRLLGYPVPNRDAADAAGIWDWAKHALRAEGMIAGPLYAGAS